MNEKAIRSVGAVVVAMLFATGLALAKTARTEFDLTRPSRIGTTRTLKPGSYLMEWEQGQKNPEARFYLDGKLVAKAHAKIVEEPQKNSATEVVSNTNHKKFDVINEIRPAGRKERVDFPS